MTVGWQSLLLLCLLLNCVDCAPSRLLQRNKYYNSFSLTRSTRTHVQQLLKRYKEQHMGNMDFEDRSQQLKALPLLSTDFYSWLTLTDWERLQAAFGDMQTYWNTLEWKRKQLENEEHKSTTLPQSIKHIQLDLRDLMSQVSSQMIYMRGSSVKPSPPTVPTSVNPETSSKSAWDRRMEGYVILRDLDLYLTKLARDFLLLASKTLK